LISVGIGNVAVGALIWWNIRGEFIVTLAVDFAMPVLPGGQSIILPMMLLIVNIALKPKPPHSRGNK